MANILQVSNIPVRPDRNMPDGQKTGGYEESQQVHNPVDISRVVRADGQETEDARNTASGNGYSVIDYESNYGAFIKKIGEGVQTSRLLEQLFAGEGTGLLSGDAAGVGELVEQMMASVRLETPEELLSFFKEQQSVQAKFSGAFFDGLRSILGQGPSDSLREAVLSFLKVYNDFSSGEHFLHQMRSIAEDINQLMFRGFRDEFEQILDGMEWGAENGDTAANTAVLNNSLIPFLSNYISRTHDYGAVRDAIMLFVFHAVRYENGSRDRLAQLYERMTGNREYERFDKNGGDQALSRILETLKQSERERAFSDAFAALLLKGAKGQGGLENVQQFHNALDGMLLNESVYMPVLHLLLPFRFREKDVMSELWINPDSEKEGDMGGRRIKLLLKFDVQDLGGFQLFLSLQDRKVDMQLDVPDILVKKQDVIQKGIAEIFKKNGMGVNRFLVKGKDRDIEIQDAFPEIRERGHGVNVRI